jgi:DNA-binding transcriptional MerR regulator
MNGDSSIPRDRIPVYKIKAVAQLLGILPVTLRAWERRYGMPSPSRGQQGYRLYSEYDVRILRWLKTQVDRGLTIGRATEFLNELRLLGVDPASGTAAPGVETIPSPQDLSHQFQHALRNFDEITAREILRRGFADHPVEVVLEDLIQPALVEIGEAWHRGELQIAVEHFATQFCTLQLTGMLSGLVDPLTPASPGCLRSGGNAPGWFVDDIVLLRWRGWDVRYLGQDLPLEKQAKRLHPCSPACCFLAQPVPNPPVAASLAGLLPTFGDLHPASLWEAKACRSWFAGRFSGSGAPAPLRSMVDEIESILLKTPDPFRPWRTCMPKKAVICHLSHCFH